MLGSGIQDLNDNSVTDDLSGTTGNLFFFLRGGGGGGGDGGGRGGGGRRKGRGRVGEGKRGVAISPVFDRLTYKDRFFA